jgi:hypothetical protein
VLLKAERRVVELIDRSPSLLVLLHQFSVFDFEICSVLEHSLVIVVANAHDQVRLDQRKFLGFAAKLIFYPLLLIEVTIYLIRQSPYLLAVLLHVPLDVLKQLPEVYLVPGRQRAARSEQRARWTLDKRLHTVDN